MFDGTLFNLRKLFKKPLKVCMIAKNYFNKEGSNGTAIHAYRISQGLAKLGCEVHVFTKGEKNLRRHRYFDKGVVVVHEIAIKSPLQKMDSLSEHRFHHALFEMAVLPNLIKENDISNFDVIHSQGGGGSGALIAKYFTGIPWIHTFHGLEKKRVKMLSKEENRFFDVSKWFESTIEFANAHITVSEDLRKEVLNEWGDRLSKDNVVVIPNGVNPDIFYVDSEVVKEKKVAYVGRFSAEKGIKMLPEIIKAVFEKNKEVSFEIVAPIGEVPGELKKTELEFNELIEKYPERIIWYKKAISREEVAKLYNRSMLIVQPSKYESFGLAVLEGMACGCVPVSSNRGGLPEVVGNAGKVVALGVPALSRGIITLLEDYRLRERYLKRGLERAKLFEWDDIALKTKNLYNKVIRDSKKEAEEKREPKVSVVIPVYNAEKYIEETIKSFTEDESFKDFELIAVDDYSTDKSYDIIRRLARADDRIWVLKNKENIGKNNSVNRALGHVRGEYVCLFDADDVNYPGRLKSQVSYLDRHPRIDMVYGDFLKLQEDGSEELRHALSFSHTKIPLERMKAAAKEEFSLFDKVFKILDPRDYIPASSALFRKNIIDCGVRMDPTLRNSEDYDFWLQIIGRGYRIRKIDGVMYKYRIHGNQKSGNSQKMEKAREYILDKLRRGGYFDS